MDKYTNAINLLTSKERFHIDLGLDRTKAILSLFGNPQENLKCIHVAGTNGKGSVCEILHSILKTAGYRVGVFISPHLFEYTERIKISGVEIDKETFADYIEEVINTADSNNIDLTEFEVLTVVMFKYFNDNNIDIAVLETGLGGRLDSTNVISKNLCSIITHIDLDHTERLGNTKDKIAFEKAGIIKQNCPVITSEGYECIQDKANELNSLFILTTPYVEPKYLNVMKLKGQHQRDNLALALAAINLLFKDITSDIIIEGLKNVDHICRFQYIPEKNMIIDGAHNPNGIKALNENLQYLYPNTKKRFIFGCLKNKDYKKMLDILFSFAKYEDTPPEIYFYHFNSPNSCSVEELQQECIYYSKKLNSIDELDFNGDKLTIVCGSFYMIKELVDESLLK